MAFIRNLIAYSVFGIDAGRGGIIVNDDDLPHPDFRLYNGGNLPDSVDDLFEQHMPAAQKGRRVEGSTSKATSVSSSSATIHDHQVATGVKGAFERPPSDPRSSSFLEAVREFGTTLSGGRRSGGKRGRSTEGTTTTASSPKVARASSGGAKAHSASRGKSGSKSRPDGEPCEEWTVKQLKEFASEKEIDLGRNSRKLDILDTVLEASLGATQ